MKIGILTFHWATNYGAVLQSYALQTYLESQNHDVEIINYKPRQYDFTIWNFFKYRKFLFLHDFIEQWRQENALVRFRKENLKLTRRYYKESDLSNVCTKYDIIISGSDQVMNPSFLLNGDKGPSSTYFIGFPYSGKRIGYAVSFGCITYPQNALNIASKFIPSFFKISTREKTGLSIIKQMGFENPILAPDPTILLEINIYKSISLFKNETDYTFIFFLRNKKEQLSLIKSFLSQGKYLINNKDGNYTINSWLSKIRYSNLVITDSFHCVVFSMLFNIPFVVLTKECGNIGMNDRFFTLLERCGISNRILAFDDIRKLPELTKTYINWDKVNKKLFDLRKEGFDFLNI